MVRPISPENVSLPKVCGMQYPFEPIVSQGVSGVSTKMTSFREEAYASKQPFLCGLISDFISWIKELFCTSNKKCEIEHPPLNYERLIQRAEAIADARLDLASIICPGSAFDYPLHLVITIKFNDRLVAMPLSFVKNEGEFKAFKLEVARFVREFLEGVDLSDKAALLISSYCVHNVTAEGMPPVYNTQTSRRGENLKNSSLLLDSSSRGLRLSREGLEFYMRGITDSDPGRLEKLRSFFGEG